MTEKVRCRLQDVVARRGKFFKLYKRAGPRVIINKRGDLIVRPSYAEASVQRIPGGESIMDFTVGLKPNLTYAT